MAADDSSDPVRLSHPFDPGAGGPMKIAVTLLLASVAWSAQATGPATPPSDLVETSCSFMFSTGEGESKFVEVPGLSVLHPPASQPKLDVQLDPGISMDGVVCWRSRAEIGPNDDWAAGTGVPLYIKQEGDAADSPVLVLELTEVGYRVRVVSGPELSSEQADQTISYIERFNLRR